MENPEANLQNVQTYIDFVKTNLEPLAQQLKVGVDFLWNILVKQAQVEAIVHLIIMASLLITTSILARIFFKNFKDATFGSGIATTKWVNKKTGKKVTYSFDKTGRDEDWSHETIVSNTNKHGLISWFTGGSALLMILIGVLTAPASLSIIVTGLVNPEYRAIEKIVEFAKPAAEKASTEIKVENK